MARIDNPIIEFSEEVAWRLYHSHDDALVVSIQIGDYKTRRVLVDNGSFADILYYLVFQQRGLTENNWSRPTPHSWGSKGLKYTPSVQSRYLLRLVIILSKLLKMLHSLLSTARPSIMPSSDNLPSTHGRSWLRPTTWWSNSQPNTEYEKYMEIKWLHTSVI